jgi:hypothetical protein
MLMAVGEDVSSSSPAGFFVLNDTGELLWKALESSKTEEELARLLITAYEVSFDQAVSDVRAFLSDGAARGILENDEG